MYVERILGFKDSPVIKILTGIRRCGKSTILRMIQERIADQGVTQDRIIHYRFDSMEYEDIKSAKALYQALKPKITANKTNTTYLFLDEIQEVCSWEKVVNSLMTDFNVDIYVTGSNSRLMSSEISTYLTGRYVTFHIFPLSFAEYLDFQSRINLVGAPQSELPGYLRFGGFPAVHLRAYRPDEIDAIILDIYNSTIYTDIVQRSQIRKVDQLERIVRFTFDNVGQTFSAASITKYLKSQRRSIDHETAYSYLVQLERADILHRCSRFDIHGREMLRTQEKFYLADPALRYAVLGYTPRSISAMLENLVYLELARRGYDVSVGKLNDGEIDFVASRQDARLYIQVVRQIDSAQTEQREYHRLLSIRDNYPKYVLVTDAFSGGSYQGIVTLHVADFLLSKDF